MKIITFRLTCHSEKSHRAGFLKLWPEIRPFF
jgi:hypothetical protein